MVYNDSSKGIMMIKLSENCTALMNLHVTIDALYEIDELIAFFSQDLPGAAHLKIRGRAMEPEIQINRGIFLRALKAQRSHLVEYLATLGVEA